MWARALLLYSKYKLDSFTDEHVYEVGMKIMDNMTQANIFPVWAVASVTLQHFIGYQATYNIFKDSLEDLLKTILDILDQYFTPGLIESLKELVREFDDHITPYAVNLCEKLSENYIEMMLSIDFESEDRGEKQIQIANGCVNAINRIIEAIGS